MPFRCHAQPSSAFGRQADRGGVHDGARAPAAGAASAWRGLGAVASPLRAGDAVAASPGRCAAFGASRSSARRGAVASALRSRSRPLHSPARRRPCLAGALAAAAAAAALARGRALGRRRRRRPPRSRLRRPAPWRLGGLPSAARPLAAAAPARLAAGPLLALLARAARLGGRLRLLLGQVGGERRGEHLDVGAELGARQSRSCAPRSRRASARRRAPLRRRAARPAQRGHEQARAHVVLLAARGGERAQQVADRRARRRGGAVLRLARGARQLPRPGQALRLRAGQRARGDRQRAGRARPARGRSPRSARPRSGAPCGRSC